MCREAESSSKDGQPARSSQPAAFFEKWNCSCLPEFVFKKRQSRCETNTNSKQFTEFCKVERGAVHLAEMDLELARMCACLTSRARAICGLAWLETSQRMAAAAASKEASKQGSKQAHTHLSHPHNNSAISLLLTLLLFIYDSINDGFRIWTAFCIGLTTL